MEEMGVFRQSEPITEIRDSGTHELNVDRCWRMQIIAKDSEWL